MNPNIFTPKTDYCTNEDELRNCSEEMELERNELLSALDGIMSIGKRDMSNPKYDGYFQTARELLTKLRQTP